MLLSRRVVSACALAVCWFWTTQATGQFAISSVFPRSCVPGSTTELIVTGKALDNQLRAISDLSTAELKLTSTTAEQATLAITLPADAPPGPLRIWLAGNGQASEAITLLVDRLPAVVDQGNNHSHETAQAIPPACVISGSSDGPRSDLYRVNVTQPQRLAVEVFTQPLGSAMDPLVRLLDSQGNRLAAVDDTAVGADGRFAMELEQAGEYILEIVDSKFVAGGIYCLRVGNFPLLSHPLPLAVQPGEPTTVMLRGDGLAEPVATVVHLPADFVGNSTVVSAAAEQTSWTPLAVSELPQIVESPTPDASETPAPNAFPLGISGQLSAEREQDSYAIQGVQGVKVRVTSRTRSLHCPTLLKMELRNAAGGKVAETAVSDADEWSFEFSFPDNGIYQLVCYDLLGRGGPDFGYWVAIQPANDFSIALKADAALREQYVLEPGHGACAVDLQIIRQGYDGEIELTFADESPGLSMINPIIPAGAKEAKIYLRATSAWSPDALATANLVAVAKSQPTLRRHVDSVGLRRLKQPHVPFPLAGQDGALLLAGGATTEAAWKLASEQPPRFARPLSTQKVQLTLQRTNEAFKAPATILTNHPANRWPITVEAKEDQYNLAITVPADVASPNERSEADSIQVFSFAEFNGRGRIETSQLDIQWYDPLAITLECQQPILAGSAAVFTVTVVREGHAAQPVTLTFPDLPAGVTAPPSIAIAAEQTQAEVTLQFAADFAADAFALTAEATTKFDEQDIRVIAQAEPQDVIPGPSSLQIYPPQIALRGEGQRSQLVVTGVTSDGRLRDWTHDVRLTSSNPEIAIVRDAVVWPVADGSCEVIAEYGSQRITIPVQVADVANKIPPKFESEVLVALSKQGCNSGACHGSPSGKGMFRLSLRAFDKSLDELTLIREDFGRRLNLIDPEESLLLLKPIMKVSHGGGKQLRKDDEAYAILRDWIAAGAPADPPGTPRCVRLEVFPNEKRMLDLRGGAQQLAVIAHFEDGSQRDVTHLVAYESSNNLVAKVDEHGLVTAMARGDAAILVRFLEHIESVPIMFVEEVPGFQWAAPLANNYVDELVNAKLQQLQYLPSETCGDAEFVRRVYLDLIGIPPTVEQAKAFLADLASDKRARLIDDLLERDEYAKFWALKWGDLLKLTSKQVGDVGVYKYYRWLENAFLNNMPYDEFAKELLTASGSTLANPAANFYRTSTDMNDSVETISQVFLGSRLQCAKCHNHPFERWTQDNYYGLSAFFNRVRKRNTQRPGEMFIWTTGDGEVTQPRTGELLQPWAPLVGSMEIPDSEDRRVAFAEWLVGSDNPFFAKNEANRIWSQLFSRGIVDPIDDFRDSNPPANGPLLDALARDFVEHGYDRKHLLRTILNSRTYQASYVSNPFNKDDTTYFSHQHPRLLTAEQLLDAVNLALGTTQQMGNLPAGTLATQVPAPDLVKLDFLKTFGQPERSTVCACERTAESNLGMAIELFNGPTIHEKLRDSNNRFRRAIAAGKSIEEVINEVYLAALSRQPDEAELKMAVEYCSQNEDVAAAVEDLCWALINTDEFLFQH